MNREQEQTGVREGLGLGEHDVEQGVAPIHAEGDRHLGDHGADHGTDLLAVGVDDHELVAPTAGRGIEGKEKQEPSEHDEGTHPG